LTIHAPEDALVRIQGMMQLYATEAWPGMFQVEYRGIAATPGAPILTTEDFAITATSGRHFIPTVGIRATDRSTGAALVYSSDTEPDADITALALGADLLIHEASGEGQGHSSASQAAIVAQDAGARRLVLVHYDRTATPPRVMRREAMQIFAGEVTVARDFDRFTW
jgi:ribonuclease Z